MNYAPGIRKAIEYVRENVTSRLKLDDVARVANVSKFHFHRLFHAQTGYKPMNFAKMLRLEAAGDRLIETQIPIVEISLDFGFSSQEHFTNAFKAHYGITPWEYRKNAVRIRHTNCEARPVVSLVDCLDPVVRIERWERTLVTGVSVECTAQNALARAMAAWKKFGCVANDLSGQDVQTGYGVLSRSTSNKRSQSWTYLAGVEASEAILRDPRLSSVEIDSTDFAVFTYRGPIVRMPQVYDYVYGTWLAQSEYRLTAEYELERYSSSGFPEEETVELLIPVEST